MTKIDSSKVVIRGLRGVAAATTKTSFVDPLGALFYCGYNIDDLVDQGTYEEVVYLLLNNELPNKNELADLKSKLFAEMILPDPVIKRIKSALSTSHPMEILRTEVSHLGELDPERDDSSIDANKRRAIRLISQVPSLISAIHRIREKEEPLVNIEGQSFAENFLYMFRGKPADKEEKKALERYLILHADHGLNASTFAARVTAGTGSDLYSAVTSAIGTLKGPFHGGASERVMMMLYEINSLDEVEAYIQTMLDDNKKIMGFGHRVYKSEDPRSRHLRELAESLCHERDNLLIYNKSKKIEQTVHDKKGIFPNVDFFSGIVYSALGIPTDLFTPIFAVSRVAGWTARVMEYLESNRIFRPRAIYSGAFDKKYIPLNKRK